MSVGAINNSVFNMSHIIMINNRYLAVTYPKMTFRSTVLQRMIVCQFGGWLGSMFVAIPTPIFTHAYYYLRTAENDLPIEDSFLCITPDENRRKFGVYAMINLVIFYVTLLLVVVVLTIRIHMLFTKDPHPSDSTTKHYVKHMINKNILAAVMVSFFVCWGPYHAERVLVTYASHWTEEIANQHDALYYASGVLFFLKTALNPLLYCIFSRTFLFYFKEIITCRKTSGVPFHDGLGVSKTRSSINRAQTLTDAEPCSKTPGSPLQDGFGVSSRPSSLKRTSGSLPPIDAENR